MIKKLIRDYKRNRYLSKCLRDLQRNSPTKMSRLKWKLYYIGHDVESELFAMNRGERVKPLFNLRYKLSTMTKSGRHGIEVAKYFNTFGVFNGLL
jgi:hypothetical protein